MNVFLFFFFKESSCFFIGRIVTITSGLALQAMPSRSVYVTSKYAMEGFCQCLRYTKSTVIDHGNMNIRYILR